MLSKISAFALICSVSAAPSALPTSCTTATVAAPNITCANFPKFATNAAS